MRARGLTEFCRFCLMPQVRPVSLYRGNWPCQVLEPAARCQVLRKCRSDCFACMPGSPRGIRLCAKSVDLLPVGAGVTEWSFSLPLSRLRAELSCCQLLTRSG